MEGVFLPFVLDSEVIYIEGNFDLSGDVGEEAQSERTWYVSILAEMLLQTVAREATYLLETVHSLSVFNHHFASYCFFCNPYCYWICSGISAIGIHMYS